MLSPTQQALGRILAFWNGKDDFRQSMMNLTLEGIFQAKQCQFRWEFLFWLGSMMALGPNRTSKWHFYNFRHENWLHSKQFATFYLLPILKICDHRI